jgi:hypothetical protein
VERRPPIAEGVAGWIEEWVEAGTMELLEDGDWSRVGPGHPHEPTLQLAAEWSWLNALDDDDRCALDEFADDPGTAPELARRARECGEWTTWGPWQVDEVRRESLLLSHYLTGVRVAAEVAPEQRVRLPRWSVLLGYFSPVDGIWRSGTAFDVASPAEARWLGRRFLSNLGLWLPRNQPGSRLVLEWADDLARELESASWLPDRAQEAPTGIARIIHIVAFRAFPDLFAELLRSRREDGREGPAREDVPLHSLLDEAAGALDGLTPREAAASEGHRERLEVFLRDLEYRQAASGTDAVTAPLRQELNLGA